MDFGLRNAAQSFQSFMVEILRDLDFAFPYIDAILIALHDKDEHETQVTLVLERLRDHVSVINSAKSVFGVQEGDFFLPGYCRRNMSHMSREGKHYPKLYSTEDPKGTQKVNGYDKLFRRFLPNAAKKNTPINWTVDLDKSFIKCKDSLVYVTLLAHPDPLCWLPMHLTSQWVPCCNRRWIIPFDP